MLPFLLLTPLIPLGIIIALILSARQRSEADVRIVGLMIVLCIGWIAALMMPARLEFRADDTPVVAKLTPREKTANRVVVGKITTLPGESESKEKTSANIPATAPPANPEEPADKPASSAGVDKDLTAPAWLNQPANWNATPPSVVVSSEPNYTVTQCQAEIAQRMQDESRRFIEMVIPWRQAHEHIRLDDDFLRKHALKETFVSYLPVSQDANNETSSEPLQQHHARLEFNDAVQREIERKFAAWRHEELQQRLVWIGTAAGGVLLTVAGLLAVMRVSAGARAAR